MTRAAQLMKEHRILTVTPVMDVPSVVMLVHGEPIAGSWWGHPAGKAIYALLTELDDDADTVSLKLVGGKVTFVHRSLWPALYRAATDEEARGPRVAALDAAAARMLNTVEAAGKIRLDALSEPADKRARARARDSLEKSLLVLTSQVHTGAGSHATVLRSWQNWAEADVVRAARTLSLSAALETLDEACRGARTALTTSTPGSRR